jgi:transcriptional regulator with XRE-family HTH domain
MGYYFNIWRKKVTKRKNSDTFHGRLRKVRKTLGLNQDTFCAGMKISKPTLVRYESGDRKPGSDFLSILADEFNVDMNWLITGKGEMFARDLSEMGILVDRADRELCELIEFMAVPQIRRSVMAEFDQLKMIFKAVLEEHFAGKAKTAAQGG